MNFIEFKRRVLLTTMMPALILVSENRIKSGIKSQMVYVPSLRIAAEIPSHFDASAVAVALKSFVIKTEMQGAATPKMSVSIPLVENKPLSTEMITVKQSKIASTFELIDHLRAVLSRVDISSGKSITQINVDDGVPIATDIKKRVGITSAVEKVSIKNIDTEVDMVMRFFNEVLVPASNGIATVGDALASFKSELFVADIVGVSNIINNKVGISGQLNVPQSMSSQIFFSPKTIQSEGFISRSEAQHIWQKIQAKSKIGSTVSFLDTFDWEIKAVISSRLKSQVKVDFGETIELASDNSISAKTISLFEFLADKSITSQQDTQSDIDNKIDVAQSVRSSGAVLSNSTLSGMIELGKFAQLDDYKNSLLFEMSEKTLEELEWITLS